MLFRAYTNNRYIHLKPCLLQALYNANAINNKPGTNIIIPDSKR